MKTTQKLFFQMKSILNVFKKKKKPCDIKRQKYKKRAGLEGKPGPTALALKPCPGPQGLSVGFPCPPIRNDIVTPHHLVPSLSLISLFLFLPYNGL